MEAISRFIGKFFIPWHRELEVNELELFRQFNFRGMLLVTYTPWSLSNLFIFGKYKHVEMITGTDHSVGARGDGILKRPLSYTLKGIKKYAILQHRHFSEEIRIDMARYAVEISDDGIEYDFELDLENDKYYCSELITYIIEKVTGQKNPYGKKILPSELYKDSKNWNVIYEH